MGSSIRIGRGARQRGADRDIPERAEDPGLRTQDDPGSLRPHEQASDHHSRIHGNLIWRPPSAPDPASIRRMPYSAQTTQVWECPNSASYVNEPHVTAGLRAFSPSFPLTQRHAVYLHILEADLRPIRRD